MARLNPEVLVDALLDRLTPANAPALVAAADVVLDCADSYAASYTLSDACLAAGKPLISASALGMAGYVGGFCSDPRNNGAPSLRALFPDPPTTARPAPPPAFWVRWSACSAAFRHRWRWR